MKWYWIMCMVAIPFACAYEYAEKGPASCADACKANGRVMASWGPAAGCTCVEAPKTAP